MCRIARGICECVLPSEVEEAKQPAPEVEEEDMDAEAYADHAFRIADKDGDGRISYAEAGDSLAVAEQHEEFFNQMDADGDGYISRAELVAALQEESAESKEL